MLLGLLAGKAPHSANHTATPAYARGTAAPPWRPGMKPLQLPPPALLKLLLELLLLVFYLFVLLIFNSDL